MVLILNYIPGRIIHHDTFEGECYPIIWTVSEYKIIKKWCSKKFGAYFWKRQDNGRFILDGTWGMLLPCHTIFCNKEDHMEFMLRWR